MAETPDRPKDPVDEYFARLDAAFATLNVPGAARAPERPDEPPVPTDTPTDTPAGAPAPSLIAEAFTALLALEEGDPGARPVRLTSTDGEPRITDALLEELTRRIIARLAPDAARAVVVQVVSEVAERLVREEIDRIRTKEAGK